MLKVCVIGGGSTYTPELISGFLSRSADFPVTEICLMDCDPNRLNIVGKFAQRMAEDRHAPFHISLTTDLNTALNNAAYTITQLRVGLMQARRRDEYLGLRHGLIGQETTGVGGMAKALRTVPVILDIARRMQQFARPDAVLVNFTNPAGLVTQALADYYPEIQAVGVCNVAYNAKMDMLKLLAPIDEQPITPEKVELDTLGLNHLTWHRGLRIDGEDVWPIVIRSTVEALRQAQDPEWDPRTIEVLRMIPNYYLEYFYYPDRILQKQTHWPPSRAEEVMLVEDDLMRQYADPKRNQPPEDLMKRGGAYYSTTATQLLNAHYNNLYENHVINIPNGSAISEWPADWVLEIPAEVSRSGFRPLPNKPLPEACFALIAAVKAFEKLTIQAAVHGDRDAAYQALLAHPLGPHADNVHDVLDDMLETHSEHLPQFRKD